MASPQIQHALALFRLEPLNALARKVVADPDNSHLVSGDGVRAGLNIGGIPSWVNDGITLANLGRRGDVKIKGPSAARVQCAFEIDPVSLVVMLYDKSSNRSTQVHRYDDGDDGGASTVCPFEDGRDRRVYVGPLVNRVIGMCGVDRNLFQFLIVWADNADAILAAKVRYYYSTGLASVAHLAKTTDDTETPVPGGSMLLRYHELQVIGEGSFGIVSRVVNVDTGKIMALKKLKRLPTATPESWERSQREVEILARISHPCIVDLIWSQNWAQPQAEIFVGLKDGSLDALVSSGAYAAGPSPLSIKDLATVMFHHMLQALDALSCANIIHRDLKPENIFYLHRAGGYYFQLGDFGLSNIASLATTDAGTKLYMAPEVHQGGQQSPKADMWSLYVTLLWTLDCGGFRDRSNQYSSYRQTLEVILALVEHEDLSHVRPMAVVDPTYRASAGQMLCSAFEGRGLVTPRDRVPALAMPFTAAPTTSAFVPLTSPPQPAAPAVPAITRAMTPNGMASDTMMQDSHVDGSPGIWPA